jgi:hypothetical protein
VPVALTGVGLTATFAIGSAFLGETRWRRAFFGGFFLIVLVFLRAESFFARGRCGDGRFLALCLAFRFCLGSCRHYNLPERSLALKIIGWIVAE